MYMLGLVFGLSTAAASAQVLPNDAWLPPTGDTNRMSRPAAKQQSQTFYSSKDLIGADVKDNSGNKLGDIQDVLISPKSGETFASVEVDGGRQAVLPIQALNVSRPAGVLRNAEVTINSTKEELQSGPTLARNEWQQLDSPSFVQSIYRHYKIQQPSSAMGASDMDSESMSGSAHDRDKSEKHKDKSEKSDL